MNLKTVAWTNRIDFFFLSIWLMTSLGAALISLRWFSGMAIIAMLPWLIKNLLATSNPFYPVFIPSGAMELKRIIPSFEINFLPKTSFTKSPNDIFIIN